LRAEILTGGGLAGLVASEPRGGEGRHLASSFGRVPSAVSAVRTPGDNRGRKRRGINPVYRQYRRTRNVSQPHPFKKNYTIP
jgi:outer membrane lipoprotein SlyB